MSKIKQLNDKNFNEEVKQGKVLVDFWAPWCGPCKMMAPVLEEVSQEVEQVTIAKVNVDENPTVAARFGVMSIPTLALLADGEEIDRIVGFVDKATLKAKL
ncbi:thioredoxin [Metallumcola ferriviriculae]|uniref:Thioredoxin n=1 Tax=Metallumcola ferriviriculae TaxID=3039180 RepID=A0AAU0UP68_9FIRM|nr:thioredoxin [Desulfitibacteraceae bacterium MK1]